MARDKILKKKAHAKNSLSVTPLGLLLAGCGGGGSDTSSNQTKTTPVSPVRLSSTTFALTGNTVIDAMTQGSKWNTNEGTLYYALANGFTGEVWNNFQSTQEGLMMAMVKFHDVTGVKTELLRDEFATPSDAADAGATIILSLDGFYMSAVLGNSAWAIGHFPNYPDELFTNQAGTMFLNINSEANFLPLSAYNPGGSGFTLLLHELGHALGLKHPHDSGGSGRPTFTEIGFGEFDRDDYTVMSYNEQFSDILHAPADFMVADVIALMYLYGMNENLNNNGSSGTPDSRLTYVNTTGKNTVFTVDTDISVEIALPYFKVSELVDIDIGWLTNIATGSTSWLMGDFNSVICRGGNDTIFGNDLDNILEAGGGNDYIEGWLGNDVLHGMSGSDTFVLGQDWGADIISDFEPGVDELWFLNDNLEVDNSLATFSTNSDGLAVYQLDGGATFTLLGIGYDVISIA